MSIPSLFKEAWHHVVEGIVATPDPRLTEAARKMIAGEDELPFPPPMPGYAVSTLELGTKIIRLISPQHAIRRKDGLHLFETSAVVRLMGEKVVVIRERNYETDGENWGKLYPALVGDPDVYSAVVASLLKTAD